MAHNITVLNNGLTIVSDRLDYIDSVSINILVKVGSRYEPPELNGISHFLEHMAFKGTATRSAKQIAEEFDAIGGYFNAYTGRENTFYSTRLLSENTETALDILADILQHSVFDPQEIKRELGVILQEIAQTHDTPDDLIFDIFQETIFPDQAIGRSILGTADIISNFTTDSFKKFVQQYYYGNNIIISVAGNIDHQYLVELVERKFSNLATSTTLPLPQAQYSAHTNQCEKELEQVHFVLGLQGTSYHHPMYYQMHLLCSILGGGMSSRLFQEVREKRGLAYSVGSFTNSYLDNGVFSIYAATGENKLGELCDVTINELLKMTKELVTTEELTRAKTQLKSGILISQESASVRSETLAYHYATYGRHIPKEEIIGKIENVTQEDILSVAQHIVNSSEPSCVAMGKLSNMPKYDTIKDKFK
jgi:predicted Zn-dependent peptidase